MIGQILNQSHYSPPQGHMIGQQTTNVEPITTLGNDVMSFFNKQSELSNLIDLWQKHQPLKNLRSQYVEVHDQFFTLTDLPLMGTIESRKYSGLKVYFFTTVRDSRSRPSLLSTI